MAIEKDTEQVTGTGYADSNRSARLEQLLMVEAMLFWGAALFFAFTQSIPWAQFTAITIGGSAIIYITNELAKGDSSVIECVGLIAAGVITTVFSSYLFINYQLLTTVRIGYALSYEYAMAVPFAFVIVYLIYRQYGIGIPLVLIGFIAYGFAGTSLPGFLSHGGFTWRRMVQILALNFQGFFGSISQIVAAWVILFLLFAGLLESYGIFDILVRGSFRVAEHIRSGVAQSAVVASLGMGSVNGTAAANAAMTGSVTIPVMKKSGLRPETAAAIEAVASSGGQIMPPIMGAAAFLMASLLGESYFAIVLAGIIPAAVYYLSVGVAVHFTALNQLSDFSFDASEHVEGDVSRTELGLQVVKFGVPFISLLVFLGWFKITVLSAALYSVMILIASAVVVESIVGVMNGSGYKAIGTGILRRTFSGFGTAATMVAPIVIVVAGINGIVDVLGSTGAASKFALALTGIAGGSLLIAAILAMLVSIILGMGMPTVAAYSFVALLIAPAIIRVFGVPSMAAHFFVFYSAILSGLTPPIAIAVIVASGVAEADFWRAAAESIKVSLPLFVLPFTFLYRPQIVAGGFSVTTLLFAVITLAGALVISVSLNSDLSFSPRINGSRNSLPVRFALVVIGVLMMVFPI